MRIEREELWTDVPSRFRRVAEAYPHSIAVHWAEDISYRDLDERSDRLAALLLERASAEDSVIPFAMESGLNPIVAILGILKAGKSYLALNLQQETAYQKSLLAEVKAPFVLTEWGTSDSWGLPTITLGQSATEPPSWPQLQGQSPASVLFTSGSTAKPKKMERSHRALLHRAYLYQQEHQVGPGDRQALTAACHFVASETDLFGALLTGATVCPYPLAKPSLRHLKTWLTEEGITLLHPPVGLFRQFLNTLEPRAHFPQLRLVALGGEPVFREDVELWKSRFHRVCRLCHRYSSSEAGNISSLTLDHESELPWSQIPAGHPCRDKTVTIEQGEIVVSSDYLSSAFEGSCSTGDLGEFDSHGLLHHLGRGDALCKVRGYRVNTARVEGVLLAIPGVSEVAVTVADDALVATLVHSGGLSKDSILEHCRSQLSAEEVPDRLLRRDRLALSGNGKVVKHDLNSPKTRTPLQESLCQIWAKHLSLPVELEDNFFELGGTSLMAAQILFDLECEHQICLPASVFSEAPTALQFSALLESPGNSSSLVKLKVDGSHRPLFLVHPNSGQTLPFYRLAQRLGAEQPVYGFRARGLRTGETPHQSLLEMAADYVQELQTVQARGPYRLGGRCMGATVALEMARILHQRGEDIESLFLFDAPPPAKKRSKLRALTWRTNEVLRWLNAHAKQPLHVLKRVHHRLTMKRQWNKEERLDRAQEIFLHMGHLVFLHESLPYGGNAVFFSGQETITQGWLRGWQHLIEGDLEVIEIPGVHGTLFHEPYVRYVAQGLQERLKSTGC